MKAAIVKIIKEIIIDLQKGGKNLKQIGAVLCCIVFLTLSFPVAIVNFFNDTDFGIDQIMENLGYGGWFNGIRHEKCLQSPPTSQFIKIVYSEVGDDLSGDEWTELLNSFSEDKIARSCIVYDKEQFLTHLDENFPSITDKQLKNIRSYIKMSEEEGSSYFGANGGGYVIDNPQVTACKTYYDPYGTGEWRLHRGIDVVSSTIPVKPPIYSLADGKVVTSTYHYSWGNYVVVEHKDGTYKSLYAHLYEPGIAVGTNVKKGQQIGIMGGTGTVSGPHLHLELYKNNVLINPAPFAPGLEQCINVN